MNGNPGGISCKSSPKIGIGGGVCKPNERNDHLRNEYKSQDANSNEMNPAAGCRPRTCKEAAHENVASDRKLDGADPISGEYFRHYSPVPLTIPNDRLVNYLPLHLN